MKKWSNLDEAIFLALTSVIIIVLAIPLLVVVALSLIGLLLKKVFEYEKRMG